MFLNEKEWGSKEGKGGKKFHVTKKEVFLAGTRWEKLRFFFKKEEGGGSSDIFTGDKKSGWSKKKNREGERRCYKRDSKVGSSRLAYTTFSRRGGCPGWTGKGGVLGTGLRAGMGSGCRKSSKGQS